MYSLLYTHEEYLKKTIVNYFDNNEMLKNDKNFNKKFILHVNALYINILTQKCKIRTYNIE